MAPFARALLPCACAVNATAAAPPPSAPKFGEAGAGGARNQNNFEEAMRKSSRPKESFKLAEFYTPDELAIIDDWVAGLSSSKKVKMRVFEEKCIWPLAQGMVQHNELGVQPATACIGIFGYVGGLLVKKVKPEKFVIGGDAIDCGAKLHTRCSAFKRGGAFGRVVPVWMTRERLEASSPMRALLSAGKVMRLSPGEAPIAARRPGAQEPSPFPDSPLAGADGDADGDETPDIYVDLDEFDARMGARARTDADEPRADELHADEQARAPHCPRPSLFCLDGWLSPWLVPLGDRLMRHTTAHCVWSAHVCVHVHAGCW